MDKYPEKDESTIKNVYGKSLILNMSKTNGCLKVTIKNKLNGYLQKTIFFLVSICTIALMGNILDINICLIITSLIFMLIFVYKAIFLITEETIMIIKGFGYYISIQGLLRNNTIFIPYERVQEIFINEVIFRHRVIYLLTLLTKEGDTEEESKHKLVPLFMNLMPRIDCLQILYKNIKYLEER